MLHDLEPLRKTSERDALIVAHFAENFQVHSIRELLELLVPRTSPAALAHFQDTTGLAVELGVVYLLDLVHELGSVDGLCRRLAEHVEGPLSRRHVAVLKRCLVECPALTAFDSVEADADDNDDAHGK